jgi:hypothetical protein
MIPTIKDATDMVDVFLYRELVKAGLVETPEESEVPGMRRNLRGATT